MYDPVPTSQRFSSVPQSNSVVPYSRYDSRVSSQPDSMARQSLNNPNSSAAPPPSSEGLITVKLVIGLLVGLVICGVPLAVMTVLYVQAKQTTNSTSNAYSGSSSTPSSGSTGTNSITLPSQCSSYLTLSDQFRLTTSTGCCYTADCSLAAAWYRITSPGGTQLATTPISSGGYCGQSYPAWYNGTFPSTPGNTVTGVSCTNYGGTICATAYATTISITNCNGFYVFYLTPFGICNIRYCTV